MKIVCEGALVTGLLVTIGVAVYLLPETIGATIYPFSAYCNTFI